jgi:putative transposase
VILTWSWRLRPTRAQHRLLELALESQRVLYNAALEERVDAWRKARRSITLYDQAKALTEIRRDDPGGYGSQPVAMPRWTLRHLEAAMQGFFARLTKGGPAGFPRYRSRSRWRSFGLAQWSGIRLRGDQLLLKGFSRPIRVNMHRPMPGDAIPKQASITRKGGRWFVNIAIETKDVVVPHAGTGGSLGIDVGVARVAAFSDGILFSAVQPGKDHAAELRRSSRALARCQRGSRRREKVKARIGRLHGRIAAARSTKLHRLSAVTARFYSTIYVEDLAVRNMTRSAKGTAKKPGANVKVKAGPNRSILDAGLSRLIQLLGYKCERSGSRLVRVNARGTSQDCSRCGTKVSKTLSVRVHSCANCGVVLDRDLNAARNVLLRGLALDKARVGV